MENQKPLISFLQILHVVKDLGGAQLIPLLLIMPIN